MAKNKGRIDMKIKCGRTEYMLTEKDFILFNGGCYQLLSRKKRSGYLNTVFPVLAKSKAEKLIKSGDLVEFDPGNKLYDHLKYYKIKGE